MNRSDFIQISGQPDVWNFARTRWLCFCKTNRTALCICAFASLAAVLGLSIFLFEGHLVTSRKIQTALVFPGLAAVIAYAGLRAGIRIGAGLEFRRNKTAAGPHVFIFGEEGLSVSTERTDSYLRWTDVEEVDDTQHVLVFYSGKQQPVAVPKTWLQPEEQVQLKNLMRRKCVGRIKTTFFAFLYPRISLAACILFVLLVWFRVLCNPAVLLYEEGSKREQAGDFGAAMDCFDQAIRENPQFAMAYCRRGYLKAELDDATGELEDCSKALVLDPSFAQAYAGMGRAKAQLGDSVGACRALSKALDLGDESVKEEIAAVCK